MADFTWMSHPDLPDTPPALIANGAVEAWGHMGWQPCEAPIEPDLTQSHRIPVAVSEYPAAPEATEPEATTKNKRAAAKMAADMTEEETRG